MPTKRKKLLLYRSALSLCLLSAIAGAAQAPTLTARLQRVITGPGEVAGRQVVFSPDSRLLATSSVDSTVKLWSVPDGKLVRTLKHPQGVTTIAFSPDGQWLVSGSYDQVARVWRLSDGVVTRTLSGHIGTIWSVAVNSDGQKIATTGEDKTIRLWRASDGTLLNTLRGHERNVWSVAFSPDGQTLASGSFDKTIKLWRTDNGALIRTLTGSGEAVVHLDFSPEGQTLASGGDDKLIRLWRVSDGKPLRSFSGSDHIYSLMFSRDGKWIATGGRARGDLATAWQQFFGNRLLGGNGKTVRLWRVSDGALQQELSGHADDVWSVALSADGRWLASSSEDNSVALWALQPR
jgi:WD40 repeat protein